MEKTKRKLLFTGLISFAMVLVMSFAMFFMPANTMTAYAASNDVTLTAQEIYDSVSGGNYTIANTYGTWTIIGTKDTEINYRKPNSEETKISTFPGATHTFSLTFTPKSQYKVVKAVLSVTIGISQHPTYSVSFNNIPISVATNAGLFDISETDTTYCTSHDTIFTMTCYSTNNSEALGTTNLQVTVSCELNSQPVSIAAGSGVKSVYLSTSQTATSGDASGKEYNANTTVYAFAKLAKGYKHKDGWTLISGSADTENAIYRVGSKTVGDSPVNFGTISADAIKYSISYDLKGGQHGTTHPSEYYVTTNTFTISNPTRTGYTFAGWTGSNGTVPQTNLQIAKGSIGDRTYTANWTANKYTINYFDQNGDAFVATHEAGYKAQHTYDSVTVLDTPTRAGHTFLGWHKLADCTDDVVTEIGAQEYVNEFNLYAKWTHNVLIEAGDGISKVYLSTSSYDLTGVESGTEYENGTQVYGYAVLEKGYNAPSTWTLVDGKSNSEGAIYRIGSGIVDQNGYDFGTVVALANHYYVMFEDGSYVVATYGENLPNLDAQTLPAKIGYTFLGFFDTADGVEGTKYYNANGTGSHAWDNIEITTLYAHFEVTEYSVTYNLDGGVAENPAKYTYFDEDITLVNPTKTGYTFIGWTGTDLEEKTMEVVIEKNSLGNRTFTANWQANEYKASIGEQELDVVYDNAMPTITAPTKKGYTFHGYFDAENGEGTKYYNADGTSAHIWDKTENVELYPYFTVNSYVVTVNDNDYDVVFDDELPELDEEDILSKTGYTFDGYYYEPEEGEAVKYYNADGTGAHIWDIDHDVELVPHFIINQYTITFNSNGGSDVDAITQDYNSAVVAPQNPEKTGYNFAGWYADEELTQAYTFDKMPAEDITLYAKWTAKTFTVTYGDKTVTATYDADMPAIVAPTKTGYTLQGYFDAEDGEGTRYYNTYGTSAHIWDKLEDTTLYAYWTINSYKVEISETDGTKSVYTALSPIAKSGNESGTEYIHNTKVYAFAVLKGGYSAPHNWILLQGTANTDGAIYYIAEVTVNGADYDFSDYYETAGIPNKCVAVFDGERAEEIIFGQKLNDLTADQIPTKAGYTFDGYSANGNKYIDKDGKCIREWDIEGAGQLSSDWVGNPHKATLGEKGIDVVYGEDMPTLTVLPTREGYTFDGAYDANNVKYYNADGTSAHIWDKDADAELTISWEINQYTITFNSNGGSDVDALTQDYNTAVAAPIAPTKAGYDFSGWFADEEFAQAYEFSTMPAQNITVYAKWTIVNYEIAYNLNNGTVDGNVATYNIESDEITLKNPTKIGYTFVGWTGTGLDEATMNVVIPAGSVGNRIYVANYTINQYTITFNSNGGSDVDALTQDYNTTVVAPVAPTKSRVTFAGWFTDEELTQSYTFNTMPAQNVTVYAKWIITANNVVELINDIGNVELTAESKAKIDTARSAYNGLSADEKALVTNYSKLTKAEKVYADVKAVAEKIDAIGEVEYTQESKDLIDDARNDYDNLTEEEKALIPTKLETLKEAEKDYATMDKDYKTKLICVIAASALGLCLIILATIYLITFFEDNKWIIENDKVKRAHVCQEADKKGRNVRKANLRKIARKEAEIYNTKAEALNALEKSQTSKNK